MRKDEYSLLPHTRENVYGINPGSVQIMGWELLKFNIPELWTLSTGKNITVGVIDTGCDLYHNDIKNNLVGGKNFVDKKKDPIDDNGHGTHVSGTIAGENNSQGIVGVSPNTKIMPLKALNGRGSGNENHIAEAIVFGSKHCDFLCMSLGSPNKSSKIYNALKQAVKNKTIIFCAAGNSGTNAPIMYPAKFSETIAIGAIDRNLDRTSFTCSGDELDFLSPGQDIFSCMPNGGYAMMSGTSMATPFAVGCACLIKSIHKNITQNNLIEMLKKTSLSLKSKQYSNKKYQGYGIINPTKQLLSP
jgi:major intracellular serine protease